MSYPIGPLSGTDEGFCHQIADTFAVVGSTDQAWTEKVCAMAMARNGSLQLGFGLGKYANRNVMDGYGGMSRGVEQVTVRSSRRLAPEPDRPVVGPLRYEVVEPLRVVRFVLEPNDCQPLAFDWTFEAALPAALEDRSVLRDGYRTTADLVRYHQIGQASGWIELDGERTVIDPDRWISTRDHSWGLRYGVGAPLPDVEHVDALDGLSFHMIWSPLLFSLPDGGRYGMLLHFQIVTAPGLGVVHKVATANASPTAPPPKPPTASTRSATPSSASPTPSPTPPASATANPSSPAPTPPSASTPTAPSGSHASPDTRPTMAA